LEHVTQQLLHLGIADDLPEEGVLNFVDSAQMWFGMRYIK
jgi:hypothetical protein